MAPPFRIPAAHFVASLLFLVVGALALVGQAPALAAGVFSSPGVVAATHLLTLGWISTSIMGALYQLLPVALGAPLRWERLADATFLCWTVGVAAFAAGLGASRTSVLLAGAGLVGVAVLLFLGQLGFTLPRAERRDLTWWCVAGAAVALLGAWVLGFLLSVNLSAGLLGDSRFPVLAVHLHVAVGGWVLLTVVGIGQRLLPMFLRSRGVSGRAGRTAGGLVAVATGLLLLSEHLLPAGVLRPALALMAAGAAAFLVQAFLFFRGRGRRPLDPGMRLVGTALALLALALAAGVAALTAGRPSPRLLVAYGTLLVPGGLGLFVAGHQYRIVPFLTWVHRFGPAASERPVPRASELFGRGPAHAALALFGAGVLAMAAGPLVGAPLLCRAGAVAFAAGSVVQAVQLVRVVRSRPG